MSDLDRAREALENDPALACVLVRGEEVVLAKGRGVSPLLGFLDGGKDFRGYSAADRVAGRAAALLYALLGVKALYAKVLSRTAVKALERQGIAYEYQTLAENIVNRAGTGLCPMEEATEGIDDPREGLAAIRERLKKLRG